jgi:hypothetical protein
MNSRDSKPLFVLRIYVIKVKYRCCSRTDWTLEVCSPPGWRNSQIGLMPLTPSLDRRTVFHHVAFLSDIVLSYQFWRSHFDSDFRAVGSVVDIDKHPFTVIGTAPSESHGTDLSLMAGLLDADSSMAKNLPEQIFCSWRGMHNI